MSGTDRVRIALYGWVLTARAHLAGEDTTHLSADPCAYARRYMGHKCSCGSPPVTWQMVLDHATRLIEERYKE